MIPAAVVLLLLFARWRNAFTAVGAVLATLLLAPVVLALAGV
jgi:hypothetical protein